MKAAIFFIALSVGAYLCLADEEEHYPSTWDSINVEDVLKNDRLLNSYWQCLNDKGKCTSDGAALKSKYFYSLKYFYVHLA